MEKDLFEKFNNGELRFPEKTILFKEIAWSKHPVFEGVELKHILTSKETGGEYSFHLVRIAPNKTIQNHTHDPQLETHEVIAGYGKCINNGKELVNLFYDIFDYKIILNVFICNLIPIPYGTHLWFLLALICVEVFHYFMVKYNKTKYI